jgi:DNA-binding NtrC family response regulator
VHVPRDSSPSTRLHLLVIGDNLYATHPLPESGSVVIGRSPACEIFIDHPSISRNHAVLDVGPPLAIQDNNSSNGTRVREVWLGPKQRATLSPGDLIELGSLQLVVQQRSTPVRRRRVWPHDYFDARLDEECQRCELTGGTFGVFHVRAPATREDALEETLASKLRPIDVIATYAPGQLEVLMCEATAAEVIATARQLSGAFVEMGLDVGIGVACFPDDGRDPDSIIGRAAERSRRDDASEQPVLEVPETGMQTLRRLVERIAQGSISVLIQGETGVGKEVMAHTIHNLSPRSEQPFLGLNCAALSELLLESELFGHERGAFTGAVSTKPGLLETADGGTVFLDEIGELPSSMQVKLLRVLEERRVMRVGGLKSKAIDVRFLAATNRDLEAEVVRGAFRQDLYFRLNGITLTIPPLRERQTEIRPLAEVFIARACAEAKRAPLPISPEAQGLLHHYAWPGNIRELKHMMERAVLLCTGATIGLDNLPAAKMQATSALPPAEPATPRHRSRSPTGERPKAVPSPPPPAPKSEEVRKPTPPDESALDFTKEKRERERRQLIAALKACDGNQSRAATMLGISRRTLSSRLDVHKLPRPRKRS